MAVENIVTGQTKQSHVSITISGDVMSSNPLEEPEVARATFTSDNQSHM